MASSQAQAGTRAGIRKRIVKIVFGAGVGFAFYRQLEMGKLWEKEMEEEMMKLGKKLMQEEQIEKDKNAEMKTEPEYSEIITIYNTKNTDDIVQSENDEFEDVAETADEITVDASVIIDESVNIVADIKDVAEERQWSIWPSKNSDLENG